jgi:MoaA/NifB/PqqE/SkfB family radical SAM enzyme
MSQGLIDAGLDMLWVSLDGATPESYADVRLGAALPHILANLGEFQSIRLSRNMTADCKSPRGYAIYEKPYIGIVFVAMKRNVDDLPALLRLGDRYAVSRFMVTNILPYNEEMLGEALYAKTLMNADPVVHVELPRMDVSGVTGRALFGAAAAGHGLTIGGADTSEARDRCPFVRAGATAVSWEGNVSPCLPLLHSHSRFVNGREHFCRRDVVGNVNEISLGHLWCDIDYKTFRGRVHTFDFSPCTSCGGCDLSENNETDCIGNPFPACGTCPWAQGVVQCP